MRGYHTNEEYACSKVEKTKMCLFQKNVLGLSITLTVVAALVAMYLILVCIHDKEAYGKGPMPGILLCISFIVGNIMLLRKKQNGFWLMTLCALPIIIPTAFNEYEEMIYFTNSVLAFLLAYYALLRIPNNRISYWGLLNRPSVWFRNIVIAIWVCFNLIMYATPFVLAINVGFTGNLFSNGQTLFNAQYGFSPSFYCHKIAEKMAQNEDNVATPEECKRWYEKAINSLRCNDDMYIELYDYIYLDYAAFLEKRGEFNQAYAIYKKAYQIFGTTETKERLDSFPIRNNILNN